MMPLTHGVTFGDDGSFRLLDRSAHVGFQFRTLHLTIAMNGIDLSIVVEEHGEIVDTSLHVMVLPRTADILRRIALQPLAVDVGKHIELPVGITDGWCPNTLPVNLLVILQREGIIREVEAIEAIGNILPVYQVLGVQDD